MSEHAQKLRERGCANLRSIGRAADLAVAIGASLKDALHQVRVSGFAPHHA